MAEFVGTDSKVGIQKRMQERQSWIAETPGAVNGGRVLSFDDPERVGWGKVAELANEDNLTVFLAVSEGEILAKIKSHLGPHWKTQAWLVYLGAPEPVVAASRAIIDAYELPSGWRIDAYERPDDRQIDAVQCLNASTGIAPYPAFYSRGEVCRVVTICLSDAAGGLVATASAAMRHHGRSRLGGYLFAGMVSVSLENRGRGLGKLVNAVTLAESQTRFGWQMVCEQVVPDNRASRAMIEACGLRHDEGLVSVAAFNSEEGFTR